MTDMSVLGEWQVAVVEGTRPLQNVLGDALKGQVSLEARNYLFSFQSYVHFEEYVVSRTSVRFGRKCSSSWAFGFDDVLELFLRTPLRHRAFLRSPTTITSSFFENVPSFFMIKAELVTFHVPQATSMVVGWTEEGGCQESTVKSVKTKWTISEERERTLSPTKLSLQWEWFDIERFPRKMSQRTVVEVIKRQETQKRADTTASSEAPLLGWRECVWRRLFVIFRPCHRNLDKRSRVMPKRT